MRGDYDRIRALLLGAEQLRLERIDAAVQRSDDRFERLPETLAESIELANATRGASRLARALSESTAESLELAVQKRPGAVVQAVFPIIGPAIRRALAEALRGLAQDLDQALQETLSLKTLRWRLECLRTGVPYASVALRHRLHYQVEHLFLIQRDSGLLLDHLCREDLPAIDADAIAGMLTAIEHFVQDSVAAGDGSGLGGATVGDYRLLLSHAPCTRIAAFVSGVPPSGLGVRLDELNEELHARYGHALAGTVEGAGESPPRLPPETLADLNRLPAAENSQLRGSRNPFVLALGGGVLAVLIIWAWLALGWMRDVQQIRRQLDDLPGFALLEIESQGRGALRIRGLHDPAAPDPRGVLARSYPGVRVDWSTRAYLSSEPEVIVRRARRQLGLPGGVSCQLDTAGVLHLRGVVPFATWHTVLKRPPAVPGVRAIQAGGLQYPGKARIDQLIRDAQSVRVDFADGAVHVDPEDASLRRLVATLKSLHVHARESGARIHVRTYGFTDEPGSLGVNRLLRLRRGEWLAETVRARLAEPVDIDVSMDTMSVRFHGRHRAANAQVTVVPSAGARRD